MKLFKFASDGGRDSGVRGFFFVEIKSLFSVVLLRFNPGSREAYHSHAFNAVTWFLRGKVVEERIHGDHEADLSFEYTPFGPNVRPKFTPRENCHRVSSVGITYALSFRGPWIDTWREYRAGKFVTLTHGRKVVS